MSNSPEIRFKGFEDAWTERRLGDLVDVCSGKDYKHLSPGEIPVYGTGGYMLSVSEALSYKKNAVGIGRKGTINKPYILNAPFWTVDTLFYCIPKDENDLDFIFDVFQNVDWKAKDESTGVPSLSKKAIEDVDVHIPPVKASASLRLRGKTPSKNLCAFASLREKSTDQEPQSEQSFIGSFFRNLDNLIALQAQKVEKLKNVKKAFLEKMFV